MTMWAIVLSGGRSRRLGGHDKARLNLGGQSLLERTVAACRPARRIVIVGPPQPLRRPADCVFTREKPAFLGPARGLMAGVDYLERTAGGQVDPADPVLVLACDVPGSRSALNLLLAEFQDLPEELDGVLACDESGFRQPLLAVYRYGALHRASAEFDGVGSAASMRAFIAPLALREVRLQEASTLDIDTWEQAASFGIAPPSSTPSPISAATTGVAAAPKEAP